MRVTGFTKGADVEVFIQITCLDCAGGEQLIGQSSDIRTLNAVAGEPGVAQVAEFWVILFAAPEAVDQVVVDQVDVVARFGSEHRREAIGRCR